MSKSVEDLSTQFELMTKQFAGFQTMMRQALDKITGRRSSADESLDSLLQKTDTVVTQVDQTVARLQVLERPHPPPPPPVPATTMVVVPPLMV